MTFKEDDFKDMAFRVDLMPPTKNPVKHFPELKLYPEFKQNEELDDKNFNKIVKYIGFLYQKNTPLRVIDDFLKRKVEAAKLAKFPMKSRTEFQEFFHKIINGEYHDVNTMILRFCRIQRSTDFSELMVYEENFYAELGNLKKETDAHKRKIVMENVAKAKIRVDALRESLLMGDDNKKLIAQLLDEVENEQLKLTPEDIAKKIRSGEMPVEIFPYGEAYKIKTVEHYEM